MKQNYGMQISKAMDGQQNTWKPEEELYERCVS